MTGRLWRVMALGGCILGAILAGLALRLPGEAGAMDPGRTRAYVMAALVAGALYAGASWLVLRGQLGRFALPAILVLALAMRALTLASPPLLSTDIFRYVWDGRVQVAGMNPYLFVPAAPELAGLRDGGTGPGAIYPNINRAGYAPTIYPPVAQAVFAAVAWVWPTIFGMKAAMLAFDLVGIGAALALLRAAALPLERVVILAWNPLVVWEFAGAGHIDAAAVGLSGLALLAAVRRWPGVAGVALAGAILCKLLPVALAPAVWRRQDRPGYWRLPLGVGAVIAVAYAAYAWGAGWRVLGYLPGYAAEEELSAGSGFLLLRLGALAGAVPAWAGIAYAAVMAAGLLLLAVWIAWRPWPDDRAARTRLVCRDAVWLGLATMLALSPHYPWYLTALALPAVASLQPAALWLMVAAPLLYLDEALVQVWAPVVVFVPALLLMPFRRAPG